MQAPRPPRSPSDPWTARIGAIDLLTEWDETKHVHIDTLVDRYLSERQGERSERAFLAQLCYGVIRHRNTLRALSEHYCRDPLTRQPRAQRNALALGIYQLAYLGTPAHAAVNETIEAWRTLMRHDAPPAIERGTSFLNATLRRASREIALREEATLEEGLAARDAIHTGRGWVGVEGLELPSIEANRHECLGLKYSHPPEMVRIWLERWDQETLIEFLEGNNSPPDVFLALRRDAVSPASFCARLEAVGVEATIEPSLPGTVRLRSQGSVATYPGYESGSFWVQDATSRRLALLLPERPGGSLLDLCAAPGGKLATILDRDADRSVLACDTSESRLRRLAENLERLRFDVKKVRVSAIPDDPTRLRWEETFDQVLVDVPCSNTGVLARRHEARWRLLPETLRRLQRVQRELLRAAVRAVAPGGDLLYTTCSVEPAENGEVVHDVLRGEPRLRLLEEIEVLPGRDGDGGYAARFVRVG